VALTAEQKKDILGQYGLHDTDTGSPEAQVALLTKRIAVGCCCWSAAGVGCSSTSRRSTWSVTAP
jgi:hypothetical protein